MVLKAKTLIKTTTLTDLMVCHNPKTVLGSCQSCDQYGRNHSCPPHIFDVDHYLKAYTSATLIRTEIESTQLMPLKDQLSYLQLSSRVLDQHRAKHEHGGVDPVSALAMFIYDRIKAQMTERLLSFEAFHSGVLGLPPGACTACSVCLKTMDKACHQPQHLRYSLESLGFNVSDVLEQFFNQKLEWTKGELPSVFQTCSCVLSDSELAEETVWDYFKGISVELVF